MPTDIPTDRGKTSAPGQGAVGQSPLTDPGPPPVADTAGAAEPAGADAPKVVVPAKAKTTKISALTISLIAGAVVLIFLLVFILQNTTKVDISFLWLDGNLQVAVAMLLSAAIGALVVGLPATARIIQLRRQISAARKAGHLPPEPEKAKKA
jgi:uncharacterized integral membrane protein